MKDKFEWNIPNVLSLSRIGIAPVIAWTILSGRQNLFTVLFVASLITDILDGFIARRFNMQTNIGARLDSLGDIFNVVLGVGGMLKFRYVDIEGYFLFFEIMISLYLLVAAIAFIRFRKFSSLHLYSSKATGYLQGLFFVVLFCYKFWSPLFWIMFSVSCLSYLEEIIIVLTLKENTSDVKGIFWVWKSK